MKLNLALSCYFLTTTVLLTTPVQALPNSPVNGEVKTLSSESSPQLTLQDLPQGFADLPGDVKAQVILQLEGLRQILKIEKLSADKVFAFIEPQKLQVVMGWTENLLTQPQQTNFDENLQTLQSPKVLEQAIAQFKQQIQQVPGLELAEYQLVPPVGEIGNTSAGMTMKLVMQGLPLRMDIKSFRRDRVAVVTAVAYLDQAKPAVSVLDVAKTLDTRIMEKGKR
ncbi:hypothetical protein [Calothrix sp. 336/3]|uniref:hypothetical protein n=1 Tax=Calothrix sp. 336/3 TaxID=1337936 RepID=UPI0011873D10